MKQLSFSLVLSVFYLTCVLYLTSVKFCLFCLLTHLSIYIFCTVFAGSANLNCIPSMT